MENIIPKLFLIQGEGPTSTQKKKWLDIFTPLHLFTQSSKNLDKYVKGACIIDKPFEPT